MVLARKRFGKNFTVDCFIAASSLGCEYQENCPRNDQKPKHPPPVAPRRRKTGRYGLQNLALSNRHSFPLIVPSDFLIYLHRNFKPFTFSLDSV